jgi:chromosome segregation and condensation protein ScpB
MVCNQEKAMIHTNSLIAHETKRPKLSTLAQQVLAAIRAYGPGTDRQIAERMGVTYQRFQPRASDLKRAELVRECGTALCRETGIMVRVIEVVVLEEVE